MSVFCWKESEVEEKIGSSEMVIAVVAGRGRRGCRAGLDEVIGDESTLTERRRVSRESALVCLIRDQRRDTVVTSFSLTVQSLLLAESSS